VLDDDARAGELPRVEAVVPLCVGGGLGESLRAEGDRIPNDVRADRIDKAGGCPGSAATAPTVLGPFVDAAAPDASGVDTLARIAQGPGGIELVFGRVVRWGIRRAFAVAGWLLKTEARVAPTASETPHSTVASFTRGCFSGWSVTWPTTSCAAFLTALPPELDGAVRGSNDDRCDAVWAGSGLDGNG
jgi:hypothetical protein